MKFAAALLVLTALLPSDSQAATVLGLVGEAKLVEHLKKKNLCYLALTKRVGESVADPIVCFVEAEAKSGGMSQKEGCTAAQYYAAKGKLIPLLSPSEIMVPEKLAGKKCTKEAVQEILKANILNFTRPAELVPAEGQSVREYLEKNYDLSVVDDFAVWKR